MSITLVQKNKGRSLFIRDGAIACSFNSTYAIGQDTGKGEQL
ncbi:hypothetical protein [Limnofasciculus baicalensis]|nr:hypothetical protein [Limnofasciculus baicalensis]